MSCATQTDWDSFQGVPGEKFDEFDAWPQERRRGDCAAGSEPLLRPVSVSDVLTNRTPPPAFIWSDYLPRGVVALWSAHGGAGKSTCALMLSVSVALGRDLFHAATTKAPVVFASMEDSGEIIRHRLAGICEAWGINPHHLNDRLHIVDATENPELYVSDNRSAGVVTATFVELLILVKSTGAGLVVIDNASDAFGGDEINRRHVRGFMRALARLAKSTDSSVCLLAHVDKSTSRGRLVDGTESYSGSTAWHNSARSRLFMSRKPGGLLTLEHQKSNFGKCREPIRLEWPCSGLPIVTSNGSKAGGSSAEEQGLGVDDHKNAASLLALIAEFESRGHFCHTGITSRSNPFAVLCSELRFKSLRMCKDDVKRVITQCDRAGWIEKKEYRDLGRKLHSRWTLTKSGREFAGLSVPSAPTVPTAP